MKDKSSVEAMVHELQAATRVVLKRTACKQFQSRYGLEVFADGGNKFFWFEVWNLRGDCPPRQIFMSSQRYKSKHTAIMNGWDFIEAIKKLDN